MSKRRAPQQKERQECPAVCVACDNPANGYHYEVPSCSPCKTFFRRTVLQERVFLSCFKQGGCTEDASIRQCRFCRFERCVRGGMNPLLIVSLANPDANPVVQRIHRLRAMEEAQPSTSSSSADESSLELVVMPKRALPSVIECKIDHLIGSLLHLEKAHQRLRKSSFAPLPSDGYRLDTVIVGKSRFCKSAEELNGEPQMAPSDPVTGFNRAQPMDVLPTARKLWPFVDLICSIEYMKTFEFFHYLSHEDKKALIRHVVIMCSHLTLAFFSYENNSDCTLHPDGSLPHNGHVPADRPHERVLHHDIIRLLRLLELDKREYVLMKALIICNPVIEELSASHKSDLEIERLKYSKSLMSYVLCRRGHEKGPPAYAGMMAAVDTLTHLMKKHKNWRVLQEALHYDPHKPAKKPSLFDDIFDF